MAKRKLRNGARTAMDEYARDVEMRPSAGCESKLLALPMMTVPGFGYGSGFPAAKNSR